VILKAQSSSVITLQWQEPNHPNGVIRKYKIIYTSDNPNTDRSNWKSLEILIGMSASLRSLSRDVKYWIRVAAFTKVGLGDYSKVATIRTLKFDRKFFSNTLTRNKLCYLQFLSGILPFPLISILVSLHFTIQNVHRIENLKKVLTNSF
jgi:hypothetical protein